MDMALAAANFAPLRQYLDDPEVFEIRVNKFGQYVTRPKGVSCTPTHGSPTTTCGP
jgi:type IV secretion system protein VirB11